MSFLKIANRIVGDRQKVFVVAEAGVNHNGSLLRAYELIDKAAWAGASAIKFQTYKAKRLVTRKAPKFWKWEGDKDKKTQFEAYQALEGFSWKNYEKLLKRCDKKNIVFLSTPFSFQAADMLDAIGMPAFKIASSDLTWHQFLRHIARKGKPILLSTGAATLGEVDEAIRAIMDEGNDQIGLLHCTLCYPTKPQDANLRLIATYRQLYPDLVVGLSDHTLPQVKTHIVAATLGASIIEKHYTVDNSLGKSADHWLSANPQSLKKMIEEIEEARKLLGEGQKRVFESEKHTYAYDKRSLVAAVDIKKGQIITERMITFKRPGTGIAPKFLDVVVGREAKVEIPEDTTITWEMV